MTDPLHTYIAIRTATHRDRAVLHAVDNLAHLGGARDALCGRIVATRTGDWNPTDPRNCRACTAAATADTRQPASVA